MVERYGMIDEAGGHEPLYFGRTTDVAPYGISGPEYVRHSDYTTLEAENTRLREDVETLKGQLVAAWNAFGPSAFRNKKPPFDIDDLDHLPSSAHGGLDEQIHSLEDQVEAAEARVAVLEKALQPFAAYLDTAAWDLNNNGDPLPDDHGMGWVMPIRFSPTASRGR